MKQREYLHKLLSYIKLESELDDFEKIHESITKDIVFKGTNLWILVFAIIVASVGLNMNSTAVIIGAMLISPLMGPINGMGYSIATYNFPLFKLALKNFLFAVIASLIASTAYFLLSPISTAHSELLARTSPTIYDVLIALFGGLAGIVAISSRQKGNVIPGVAIATALMPPLCTAGYGLATGQLFYFFGAFYLFTINSVFIAISSVIISQILKFPIRTVVDKLQRKRINRWISYVISIVLIPSIYFGYKLVLVEKFNENAARFVKNISVVEGNYLLKSDVQSKNKSITLVYAGASLSDLQKDRIREKAKDYSLENATIDFYQGMTNNEILRQNSEQEQLQREISRLNLILEGKDLQLEDFRRKNNLGRDVLKEINVLYPQIESCSISEANIFKLDESEPDTVKIVLFKLGKGKLGGVEREKIENWLKIKFGTDEVFVYYN